VGVFALLMGLVMVAYLFATGEVGDAMILGLVAAMGAAALGANAIRLPRWAEEREEQMEIIATRARMLIRGEPAPEPG